MSAGAASLLRARAVSKRVRDGESEHVILQDVDIEVGAGERIALMGPSGSGKSTLLQILGALDPDYDGSVAIDGHTLEALRDSERASFRNRTVGFVFQAYNLLAHLSAIENVLLPARFSREAPDSGRAHRVLETVGLGEKGHRRPAQLSGGERQRVAIARALYHRPKLVLCDEPTGNLDASTGAEILALFDELVSEGTALLVATHDPAIAETAERILRVRGGRLA